MRSRARLRYYAPVVIYRLFSEPVFPSPEDADPDGLLAVGGDLTPQRLLSAYAGGIFPWYGPDSPILWWSTDPRLVLFPDELHLPRSLQKVIRQKHFRITFDTDFGRVIRACASTPRPDQEGTWILPEMIEAYEELHRLGFAHSVEAWSGGRLAGGMYGVSLGGLFFGESMFYHEPNASKAALAALMRTLKRWGFVLMDCQQTTEHMQRFGAREISRKRFLVHLAEGLRMPTLRGVWNVPPEE